MLAYAVFLIASSFVSAREEAVVNPLEDVFAFDEMIESSPSASTPMVNTTSASMRSMKLNPESAARRHRARPLLGTGPWTLCLTKFPLVMSCGCSILSQYQSNLNAVRNTTGEL